MKPDPARLALAHALGLLAAAKHVIRASPAAAAIVRTAERDLRELDKAGLLFPSDERLPEPPAELLEALSIWLAYKAQQHHFTYKPIALAGLYEEMRAMGPERAMAAVRFSRASGHKGLVEPRNGHAGAVKARPHGTTEKHVDGARDLDKRMGLR